MKKSISVKDLSGLAGGGAAPNESLLERNPPVDVFAIRSAFIHGAAIEAFEAVSLLRQPFVVRFAHRNSVKLLFSPVRGFSSAGFRAGGLTTQRLLPSLLRAMKIRNQVDGEIVKLALFVPSHGGRPHVEDLRSRRALTYVPLNQRPSAGKRCENQ